MNTVRWICFIGLVTMWPIVAGAQEARPDAAPEAPSQAAPPTAPAPEAGAASEANAPAAGEGSEANAPAAGEGSEANAPAAGEASEANAPAAGEGSEAGAPAAGEAPPEVVPLDELFIPSREIAADEEVIFPVNI